MENAGIGGLTVPFLVFCDASGPLACLHPGCNRKGHRIHEYFHQRSQSRSVSGLSVVQGRLSKTSAAWFLTWLDAEKPVVYSAWGDLNALLDQLAYGTDARAYKTLLDSIHPHTAFTLLANIIAMLFLVFDVETIFLFPWAVIYDKLALFGLVEMLIFIGILAVGYYYAWRKGALEWA